eukprot:scaffold2926_cov109-Skeletonema_dohrnii-CCMP3373.AAC.3
MSDNKAISSDRVVAKVGLWFLYKLLIPTFKIANRLSWMSVFVSGKYVRQVSPLASDVIPLLRRHCSVETITTMKSLSLCEYITEAEHHPPSQKLIVGAMI